MQNIFCGLFCVYIFIKLENVLLFCRKKTFFDYSLPFLVITNKGNSMMAKCRRKPQAVEIWSENKKQIRNNLCWKRCVSILDLLNNNLVIDKFMWRYMIETLNLKAFTKCICKEILRFKETCLKKWEQTLQNSTDTTHTHTHTHTE